MKVLFFTNDRHLLALDLYHGVRIMLITTFGDLLTDLGMLSPHGDARNG